MEIVKYLKDFEKKLVLKTLQLLIQFLMAICTKVRDKKKMKLYLLWGIKEIK